jgi:hypothetical protein
MKILLISLGLLLFCTQNALSMDGADLQRSCGSIDKAEYFENGKCLGYVQSVVDYVEGMHFICVLDPVRNRQLIAIVSKYLNEHPERWHESAFILAGDALQAAFPCKK